MFDWLSAMLGYEYEPIVLLIAAVWVGLLWWMVRRRNGQKPSAPSWLRRGPVLVWLVVAQLATLGSLGWLIWTVLPGGGDGDWSGRLVLGGYVVSILWCSVLSWRAVRNGMLRPALLTSTLAFLLAVPSLLLTFDPLVFLPEEESNVIVLQDPQPPLLRTYWHVMVSPDGTAYMIPRPDGAPQLKPVCADPTHPLHAVVERTMVCSMVTTTEQGERVNHMLPIDALQLSHFLHSQLRFEVKEEWITPYADLPDVIAACDLHPEMNSAGLIKICDYERAHLKRGTLEALIYPPEILPELAARLNELYGIR